MDQTKKRSPARKRRTKKKGVSEKILGLLQKTLLPITALAAWVGRMRPKRAEPIVIVPLAPGQAAATGDDTSMNRVSGWAIIGTVVVVGLLIAIGFGLLRVMNTGNDTQRIVSTAVVRLNDLPDESHVRQLANQEIARAITSTIVPQFATKNELHQLREELQAADAAGFTVFSNTLSTAIATAMTHLSAASALTHTPTAVATIAPTATATPTAVPSATSQPTYTPTLTSSATPVHTRQSAAPPPTVTPTAIVAATSAPTIIVPVTVQATRTPAPTPTQRPLASRQVPATATPAPVPPSATLQPAPSTLPVAGADYSRAAQAGTPVIRSSRAITIEVQAAATVVPPTPAQSPTPTVLPTPIPSTTYLTFNVASQPALRVVLTSVGVNPDDGVDADFRCVRQNCEIAFERDYGSKTLREGESWPLHLQGRGPWRFRMRIDGIDWWIDVS